MAVNYFENLGFGNFGERQQAAAQKTQAMRGNEQAMQMNDMNMMSNMKQEQRQVKADEQKMLQFKNEQQKQRAAQGAGAFYNALNLGDDEVALSVLRKFAPDINSTGDPSFTDEKAAILMQTPEGKEQLKNMAIGMIQLAAGPEYLAKFTAQQAKPETQAEATAQIKNTAEYRRYTDEIRKAVSSKDFDKAKALQQERDFFVNQVDPYARAFETGKGAGAARIGLEQALTPEMVARTQQQEAAKITEQTAQKQKDNEAKNSRAFQSYQQAAASVKALSPNAGSGAFGLAPAVFADDRLFDGAIAILRPAIKDVVRGAGEGTFSEGDQAVIDKMMPTRTDSPQVRMAKMQMLDNYIMNQLGQTQAPATKSEADIMAEYGL